MACVVCVIIGARSLNHRININDWIKKYIAKLDKSFADKLLLLNNKHSNMITKMEMES